MNTRLNDVRNCFERNASPAERKLNTGITGCIEDCCARTLSGARGLGYAMNVLRSNGAGLLHWACDTGARPHPCGSPLTANLVGAVQHSWANERSNTQFLVACGCTPSRARECVIPLLTASSVDNGDKSA